MNWDQRFHSEEEAQRSLSKAKYDGIQNGMTYEELVAWLEIPPGVMRPDDDMKYVTEESSIALTWYDNDKKRSITVHLKGKKVVDKSQTGLR